jgi:hypothetical protein
MKRYLLLAACSAPVVAPVSNASSATPIQVLAFTSAAAKLPRANCTTLPGPAWPEAEEAVLRQIRGEHAGHTVKVERIASEKFVDIRYVGREASADIQVVLRVTQQRGYVYVGDPSIGAQVYCVDVKREGKTFELVPTAVRWEVID